MIILGLIVAIFIAAAIFAPSRNAPDADVSPSPTPPSSPPAITPADLEAARPHGLTASENGTAATLTWENGSTSEGLAVQLSDAAGLGALQTLPDGATAYEVPGLDPTQGYCFRVGAILGIEPTTGVVAAWSPYTCIRGARPPG